jgi:hypothetical protein
MFYDPPDDWPSCRPFLFIYSYYYYYYYLLFTTITRGAVLPLLSLDYLTPLKSATLPDQSINPQFLLSRNHRDSTVPPSRLSLASSLSPLHSRLSPLASPSPVRVGLNSLSTHPPPIPFPPPIGSFLPTPSSIQSPATTSGISRLNNLSHPP